jgi:hypothetical protein
VTSRFLLSGLARCGYCGKALVGQDAKSGQFFYYVCGSLAKKGAGSCQAKRLNSKHFEGAVINEIKKRILTEENMIELVRLMNEEMDSTASECHERLHGINDGLQDTQRRLDRLYDAIETGKLENQDLATRIRELRIRQAQLQLSKEELEEKLSDRRVELADINTLTIYAADMRRLLDESGLPERRAFIRSFVKELVVKDNTVKVTYTAPFLSGAITEEDSVLPIVHNGG